MGHKGPTPTPDLDSLLLRAGMPTIAAARLRPVRSHKMREIRCALCRVIGAWMIRAGEKVAARGTPAPAVG